MSDQYSILCVVCTDTFHRLSLISSCLSLAKMETLRKAKRKYSLPSFYLRKWKPIKFTAPLVIPLNLCLTSLTGSKNIKRAKKWSKPNRSKSFTFYLLVNNRFNLHIALLKDSVSMYLHLKVSKCLC